MDAATIAAARARARNGTPPPSASRLDYDRRKAAALAALAPLLARWRSRGEA